MFLETVCKTEEGWLVIVTYGVTFSTDNKLIFVSDQPVTLQSLLKVPLRNLNSEALSQNLNILKAGGAKFCKKQNTCAIKFNIYEQARVN